MRALAIDYTERALLERDIAEPQCRRDDEVLLQVLQVGVCGTDRDLAALRIGRGPEGDDYLVPGHEAACRVLKVSGAVQTVAEGDIVVPLVRRPCAPPCALCAAGRRDLCSSMQYTERGIIGAHGYFTELAVDPAADLVRIPEHSAPWAVLLEPLSVVEKAIDVALRLHVGEVSNALVIGAGSIGLLTAAALTVRGIACTVQSVEPEGSPRARLAAEAGADYTTRAPESNFDIAIEAAGAPHAVAAGLASLRPNGVVVVLGARSYDGKLPLLDMILGNRILAGSVNAGPRHFQAAADDLGRIPETLRNALIEYRPWGDFRRSFLHSAAEGEAPKIVHLMQD